jgi:hypothetical protein
MGVYVVDETDRTNVATNPQGIIASGYTNAYGWQPRWFGGGGGNGTRSQIDVTGQAPASNITTAQRKTWTVSPTGNGDTGFAFAAVTTTSGVLTTRFAITPGQTVTASVWLRMSSSSTYTFQQRLTFYDVATGGTALATTTATAPVAGGGGWVRVSVTATAPAGATFFQFFTDPLTSAPVWQPGDMLDGTGVLIETTDNVGTFFDGNTPDAGTVDYAWTGTANASTSTRRADAVVTLPGVAAIYVDEMKVWPTVTPLPAALGAYTFDDTSADVAAGISRDTSGNGRDILAGATAAKRRDPGHESQYAAHLALNVAGAASGNPVAPFATPSRTFTFWHWNAAVPSAQELIGFTAGTTQDFILWVTIGGSAGRYQVSYRRTSGSANYGTLYDAPAQNVWLHHAIVFDDATLQVRAYINGVLGAQDQSTGPVKVASTDFWVDRTSKDLIVDTVRFYDVALTPAQIAEDMALTAP